MTTIEKGTEAYKNAQTIANKIQDYAGKQRWNNNSFFSIALDTLSQFLGQIMTLDCFAAQIAKTVDSTINPYGYQVARCSSKQAWILACAAVENGINF